MKLYRYDKKGPHLFRLVFVLVMISGALASPTACQKAAPAKEKITVGVSHSLISSPVIIAREKGFFSDEGLDVVFKPYPSGKKAMEGMLAGEADIATAADTPVLFSSLMHDDFAIFATIAHSYNDCKVLGRKDRGVVKPSDLKGKTIGAVLGTASHFFAHVYLAEHGIDLSAVTIVDIGPADLPGALKEGRVDAIVVWEPFAYHAQNALPDKVTRLPQSNLYRETFNLSVMKAFAGGHPGGLIKILKAVDRATIFMRQNRKESIAIVTKALKLEEDMLNALWDDFVFELSLDHSLLVVLEDEARWAIENKLTERTKVPNYLGYVYLDAMKAVKSGAATIRK